MGNEGTNQMRSGFMYTDRLAAGKVLAEELKQYHYEQVLILAVPRGGIIVAEPIASLFKTGLDVLVTRKIGHPHNREFAIGAVMPDGSAVVDAEIIQKYHVSREYLEETIAEQYAELRRRMLLYTGRESLPEVGNKTVIVVDDGMATGYNVKAAVRWLKTKDPLKIVVAVPVAPPEVVRAMEQEVDVVICPLQPELFMSVGEFYQDFAQVSDSEVIAILDQFHNQGAENTNLS
jgi:predicted phosphoribosyltransferase